MTKKDYELIADVLGRACATSAHHPALSTAQRSAAKGAIEHAAFAFAGALAATNPRSYRTRFLTACGMGERSR